MPLFGRGSGPSDEERQAAEVDLERIREGGIPLGAEQRLGRVGAAKTPFFTSDLSANEYAIAQASGLSPVALVMGSSVVQHGWQRYNWGTYGGWGQSQELRAFSDPWNLSRQRAFDRLRQEAVLAGADAVIGIELTSGALENSSDVEYVVFGTAVRESTLPVRSSDGPRLCSLSGQDVDKLRRIGAATCGLVGHTAVVCVGLSWAGNQALTRWYSGNQELTEITQGVYDARRLVVNEVHRQAAELNANDIVITTLTHNIGHHEYERAGAGTQHVFIVTMHLLGTAIRLGAHAPHPAPLRSPVLSIDLRG